MAIIGYIRVSSNKQTVVHQRYEMQQFAIKNNLKITHWVEETISSRQVLSKRKLGRLLDKINDGDILIACEISRLGRSLLEVMRILEVCLNKNCQVWTIKESYRLGNDIQSKVMAFAFGLAAEIERNLISERTRSSLANIKASGRKLGRPISYETRKLRHPLNAEQVQELLKLGLSKSEIARIIRVHRHTLRRFIAQKGWEPLFCYPFKVSHPDLI